MSLALWPQSPSAAWLVSRQAAFQPEAPECLSLFVSCEHLGRAVVLMLSDYHHSLLTHTWTNKLYENIHMSDTQKHWYSLFFYAFFPKHPLLPNPDLHSKRNLHNKQKQKEQYSDIMCVCMCVWIWKVFRPP